MDLEELVGLRSPGVFIFTDRDMIEVEVGPLERGVSRETDGPVEVRVSEQRAGLVMVGTPPKGICKRQTPTWVSFMRLQ